MAWKLCHQAKCWKLELYHRAPPPTKRVSIGSNKPSSSTSPHSPRAHRNPREAIDIVSELRRELAIFLDVRLIYKITFLYNNKNYKMKFMLKVTYNRKKNCNKKNLVEHTLNDNILLLYVLILVFINFQCA